MDDREIQYQKAQRELRFARINIFTVVKTVRWFRDIFVANFEVLLRLSQFNDTVIKLIQNITQTLQNHDTRINDINKRLDRLEGRD